MASAPRRLERVRITLRYFTIWIKSRQSKFCNPAHATSNCCAEDPCPCHSSAQTLCWFATWRSRWECRYLRLGMSDTKVYLFLSKNLMSYTLPRNLNRRLFHSASLSVAYTRMVWPPLYANKNLCSGRCTRTALRWFMTRRRNLLMKTDTVDLVRTLYRTMLQLLLLVLTIMNASAGFPDGTTASTLPVWHQFFSSVTVISMHGGPHCRSVTFPDFWCALQCQSLSLHDSRSALHCRSVTLHDFWCALQGQSLSLHDSWGVEFEKFRLQFHHAQHHDEVHGKFRTALECMYANSRRWKAMVLDHFSWSRIPRRRHMHMDGNSYVVFNMICLATARAWSPTSSAMHSSTRCSSRRCAALMLVAAHTKFSYRKNTQGKVGF